MAPENSIRISIIFPLFRMADTVPHKRIARFPTLRDWRLMPNYTFSCDRYVENLFESRSILVTHDVFVTLWNHSDIRNI